MTLKQKSTGSNISFGTTTDRSLFPLSCGKDRLGNELVPIRSPPHRYPGMYKNELKTSSIHQQENHYFSPGSKHGKYLNRSEIRFFRVTTDEMSDPGLYQKSSLDIESDVNFLKKNQPANYQPFLAVKPRFVQKKVDTMFTPGPGKYDVVNLRLNRKVEFPGEFGSRPDMKQKMVPEPNAVKSMLKSDYFDKKKEARRAGKLAYFSLYY